MADAELPQDAIAKKSLKLPLIIGLVIAAVLGGGGFYATSSGLLFAPADSPAEGEQVTALPDIQFVPINPLVISLGSGAQSNHLRFTAHLEVNTAHNGEVTHLLPRIVDVLNGYLRAVEISELEDPTALVRLRAQMLRRIQIVAGEGRVRDLLVTEFVLN